MHAGIVDPADLPEEVVQVCGRSRREQLNTFVRAVVTTVDMHGEVGMPPAPAAALAALRAFNYERIYVRPASLAQSAAVVEILRALVEFYAGQPTTLPDPPADHRDLEPGSSAAVRAAVTYVAGMTDRYAFEMAEHHLGWAPERLPQGIDRDR